MLVGQVSKETPGPRSCSSTLTAWAHENVDNPGYPSFAVASAGVCRK